MLYYGIRIYWHPSGKRYDRYSTLDLALVLDNVQACIKYKVKCETFVTYEALSVLST